MIRLLFDALENLLNFFVVDAIWLLGLDGGNQDG
jgi:hypothetical protein